MTLHTPGKRFLTAEQAAAKLGVKPATLYAYVSRGLLRSHESADPRARLYMRDEVERLRLRRDRRRDPRRATEGALDWGLPVLESKITLLAEGSVYYRGHEASELARTAAVEEVAALLWRGDMRLAGELFPAPSTRIDNPWQHVLSELADRHPGERLQVLLRYASTRDAAAMDLRPERLAATGARLLTLMIAAIAGRPHAPGEELLAPLLEAWFEEAPGADRLLHGTLILCADHELNVSSFTARCVASAGASPYDVVIAGLSALRGFRHGGDADRVEELLADLGVGDGGAPPTRERARRRVEDTLQRGERIPGFGQRLYPQGDPRQRSLMDLLQAAFPDDPDLAAAIDVAREVEALIEIPPSMDFGLAVLSRVAGLDRGGAFTVFALGRTIGWIAHAIEQYESGQLIRPRARYVGPPPR